MLPEDRRRAGDPRVAFTQYELGWYLQDDMRQALRESHIILQVPAKLVLSECYPRIARAPAERSRTRSTKTIEVSEDECAVAVPKLSGVVGLCFDGYARLYRVQAKSHINVISQL